MLSLDEQVWKVSAMSMHIQKLTQAYIYDFAKFVIKKL